MWCVMYFYVPGHDVDCRYVRVADRPLKEQLRTPEFIYLFVFTIVHMVRVARAWVDG
jgi:hypothetical protein